MALETDRESAREEREATLEVLPLEERIPAASWLSAISLHNLRQLERESQGVGNKAKRVKIVPLADPFARRQTRIPLYLVSHESSIRLDGQALVLEGKNGAQRDFLIQSLSHLVFLGRNRATVPALLKLAREGVPSYFCSWMGELQATFAEPAPRWQLWQQQARATDDPELRVAFAREVVAAKIHNATRLVVRFDLGDADDLSDTLAALEESVWNKRGPEGILGLEGQSARLYFAALARSLAALPEKGWGFAGRNKHPPRDPVNSLLSFGYHLLGYHTATALTEAGLNPHLGLFHEPTYRFPALAADLQEEFRHLVDAFVWGLIHRRWVKPKDFQQAPGNAVYLKAVARRKFVEWFEERILTQLTPPGATAPVTYRELIAQQALQIRELVQGRMPKYQPLRIES